MAQNIPELYGSLVFNDKVMRSKLPKDMYKALKKTIESGTHLERRHSLYSLVPANDKRNCRET